MTPARPDRSLDQVEKNQVLIVAAQLIAEFLRKTGCRVTLNDPCKVGELIRRRGDLACRLESTDVCT